MISHVKPMMAVILGLMAAFIVNPAYAMGHGKGETKIDFKLKIGDSTSSRLFAKLNVATGVGQLPETGSKSKNDNLAGQTIILTIGSADFSGTADEKGKVTSPFNGKLTANGEIMQIKADGLNLEELFPVASTDGEHSVTVAIKVTASSTDSATGVVTTVVLSDQSVTFNYVVKKGSVKGRNF